MIASTQPPPPPCPDDAILEEYAVELARGAPVGRGPIENHIETCNTCQRHITECLRETNVLVSHLAVSVETQKADTCLTLEDLGLFLDHGLATDEQDAAQSHLAHCAQCRHALGALYREVVEVMEDEEMGAPLFPQNEYALGPKQHAIPVSAEEGMDEKEESEALEVPVRDDFEGASITKERKPRQSTL